MKKPEVPYLPVNYEAADVSAIQLLSQGECPEHLQKRALDWIINKVCATYDQSYRQDTHDTAFAEGRRFCGNQIIKMLKLDANKLRSSKDE